jgi:dihydroorotate dehydrogenase (fumarate)
VANSPELPRARRRVRDSLAGALLVALIAIVTAPLAAAPAHADDTIGISARPAGAEGNPDGRTRFSYQVDPGQSIQDTFLVANTGNVAQDFTVVGTDAFNDDEGEFALLATAEQPTGIGAWVQFENGANRIQFTLGPGERRALPFTVTLPAEATPGDHVGGLVASVITPGEQVNLDRRVATRVYARVSGQLQPRLAISGLDASYSGDWWNLFSGTVTVRYTVDNPGNIALAANLSAGVNTWFGIPAAPASTGTIEEVLPGNSAAYEFDVPAVAQWGYLGPYLRLNPFVDDPDPANQLPVAPVSRDTFLLAVPWLVVIALALGVLVVLGLRWRRRRDEARAEAWMEHTRNEALAQAQREAELVGSGGARRAGDG